MSAHKKFRPDHFLDPKVIALQTALRDRDPFCSGICTIPDYQRLLYYTCGDDLRRIELSNAGADDLEGLYRACKPAEFGRNGENVLDESYRKAGKMDLTSFATLLDPRTLGIYDEVSKALLTQSFATMDMELYKLNVYGKGDFFKAHKDTPRSQDMFGSLVVVLPTQHQGGQFVLRQEEKEWTIDFADKFATAAEPSVFFVAFFSDIEHEVLPVTSGYRVTLTYNMYHKPGPMHSNTASIPTPFQLKLKQTLVDLVNDKSKLPKGGYLGFGLVHEYVHTGRKLLEPLLGQLKGSDRALADVCDELGLRYSLRLLYRGIVEPSINLIATNELEVDAELMPDYEETYSENYLQQALEGLTIEEVEGVILPRLLGENCYSPWLRAFYKDPATEVLEITPMKSSVDIKTSFMTYGNEAEFEYFYGTACMLVAVEPAESRDFVQL
ncbi:hypothetical protein HD554DRAFT_2016574 [Boletus coccyginus]|nr:hypothetical protein HD554DRAFT_2016574 [Boletus coccyginus]